VSEKEMTIIILELVGKVNREIYSCTYLFIK